MDNGATVTLRNSDINLTVNKGNLTVTSIYKRGGRQSVNLLNGGRGYYFLNYVVGSDRRMFNPESTGNNMVYQLIQSGPDRAEIALSFNEPSKLPFHFEYRFVIFADEPGFYMYSIFRYPEGEPNGAGLEQSRYSFRANASLFNHYGIEDASAGDRLGRFPRPNQLRARPPIFDATFQLVPSLNPATLEEEIYTKYEHSVFMGDNRIFSLFGSDIGMHLIRPSDEYLVGGPEKQEYLTEMTTTGPMLHFYEQVRHYGPPNVMPEKGWEKIYGPFFVYFNEGADIEAMWGDAKARADDEVAALPYARLADPLYQAAERSVVEGRLSLTDGTSAERAWVILGQPGLPVFEQNLDYLYYVRAETDGSFAIPHVRPGTYTLYAHVDGVPGEFRHDGIEVGVNTTEDIGELQWTPPHHGELLWQLGAFDRTPREFRRGDRLREWGNWLLYPLDFPEGVHFRIGTSTEAEDWNYFQPSLQTPGDPGHLFVADNLSPAPWNIHFDLATLMEGSGTLTIAIAGATFAGLEVHLNGTEIADLASIPPQPNDFSFYRSGVAGYYRVLILPFDASLLRQGDNTVTLLVKTSRSGYRYAAVMYDALRMEVDPDRPYVKPFGFSGSSSTTRNVQSDCSSIMVDLSPPDIVDRASWKQVGVPVQRHGGGNVIGDLRALGAPGGTPAWNFMTFSWEADEEPDESHSGSPAGLSSGEGVNPGEGYAMDILLPAESGTLTFLGVTRLNTNKLIVEDAHGIQLFISTESAGQQWNVTAFSLQREVSVPNTTVTLKWVSGLRRPARCLQPNPTCRSPKLPVVSAYPTHGTSTILTAMPSVKRHAASRDAWFCRMCKIRTKTTVPSVALKVHLLVHWLPR